MTLPQHPQLPPSALLHAILFTESLSYFSLFLVTKYLRSSSRREEMFISSLAQEVYSITVEKV